MRYLLTIMLVNLFVGVEMAQASSIVSWGKDDFGQVSNTPTETDFITIDGGFDHSLALRAGGSIGTPSIGLLTVVTHLTI